MHNDISFECICAKHKLSTGNFKIIKKKHFCINMSTVLGLFEWIIVVGLTKRRNFVEYEKDVIIQKC